MPSASFPAAPAGAAVRIENGRLCVPDRPIIPFIEGDGIGPDIWAATRRVLEAAVAQTYGGTKGITWYEVFAGETANERFGEWLPEGTVHLVGHGEPLLPEHAGLRKERGVALPFHDEALDVSDLLDPVSSHPGNRTTRSRRAGSAGQYLRSV